MKLKQVTREQLQEAFKKELDDLVKRMPETVHVKPTVAFVPPCYLVDVTQKKNETTN
jgi:hypothetical protein